MDNDPAKAIRFATAQDKLARDLAEYDGASPDRRHLAVLELAQICETLLESSPRQERQIALLDERERIGRERMKEWIRSHAGKATDAHTAR